MNTFQSALPAYFSRTGFTEIHPKALLFDMDGVLFNSMPFHAKAWTETFASMGVEFSLYDAYMAEGRTGAGTIADVFMAQKHRMATEEEIQQIYAQKSDRYDACGPASKIPGIDAVLKQVQDMGLDIFIVTGSGQHSLLNTLNDHFPGVFSTQKMITAYDVKQGKPFPEPYLMALQKGNMQPNEAIVIENAPLGVQAGNAAQIFTIAVNTGILKREDLSNAGADLVLNNMQELLQILQEGFA